MFVVVGVGLGKIEIMLGWVVWFVVNGYVNWDEIFGFIFMWKVVGELVEWISYCLVVIDEYGWWGLLLYLLVIVCDGDLCCVDEVVLGC